MPNKQSSILVVDDEPDNVILLEALLASEGYITISANGGKEALKVASNFHPDLILLDVMMPEIDGFEVCHRLRKNYQLKTIPIIFLTALDDENSKLKGLELMGDDYITKPFNSRLLLAKVANILQLNQIRSQANKYQNTQQTDRQSNLQLLAAEKINQHLSEKFRLFVPEQFLSRIAPQGLDSIQLGDVAEEELTVLFCDIRGFTAIAESQNARDTFKWLNSFFQQMSVCISANQGFIDKFLGDAIMAVFDKHKCHSLDALKAAVMMQENLKEFNANYKKYNLTEPVKIGIGIHTGMGVIGTLGSEKRMDSTVIGDVVNTASRLESLTKTYCCSIIVSELVISEIEKCKNCCQAQEYIEDKFRIINQVKYSDTQLQNNNLFSEQIYYRWIDKVTLRGKQKAMNIYELLGTENSIIEAEKISNLSIFKKGIKGWQVGKFAAALEYFQQVKRQNSTDTIASLYVERCREKLGKEEGRRKREEGRERKVIEPEKT
ncbi:MAG: adenylate/guanylate cyclase domain-containing response regulator [Okeania sp. SIO2G4]|uniref:response regulator n=1 Tax=unclassified Okeania TaxID=2634635 RepID=UPI0013BAC9DB|nr:MULTISPECIES: response regulator [unclassified Okeania]NEP39214.1 adenylate/guanylate cyclase domain-containing response regulator [Okeania sp. SIO2H7]NEP71445.1 adenylate/guanylate cyclase domain-containing response regulator [Okeania sp. SIO2G5]NEP96179.1 adenylate/guanylate cyclase domain-containing response regulator [Okeania sp. SIO2F5]NEQ93948.1 adenylate/guanylate cyclase domain-containing response regulator [Okeania sp. SIO2G4]